MGRGAFIVIEGIDGTGKTTQTQLLHNHLVQAGYTVEIFDFPRYEHPSAYFVERYLNGHYDGEGGSTTPYQASLFFALDRFGAAADIRAALEAGMVVICNRYVGSNMGHQGGRLTDDRARADYFNWVEHLEFELLKVPKPDVSVVLQLNAEVAQRQVDKKDPRSYTDQKRDLHEVDLEHLQNAEKVYEQMCEQFPQTFIKVSCGTSDRIDSIESIQERIWGTVKPFLPPRPTD